MSLLFIGTSGYDYPEWKEIFYPKNLTRSEYLSFYAEHFNALELNFSYYSQPNSNQLRNMVQATSGKVHFSIKGNQSFTHCIEIGKWKDAVKEFKSALQPLLQNNVLLSVLLQFPQSFHYEDETRLYLANLISEFGKDIPLVVEFRHNSWQRNQVYSGLTERGIGYCITDMPEMNKLPSFNPVVTGTNTYIRFHGRNNKDWYGTNARDRYNYLYNDNELLAFKPVIETLSGKAQLIQIFFNNHAKGNATINARKLMILLNNV